VLSRGRRILLDEIFPQALRAQPGSVDAHFYAGLAAEELKLYEDAARHYEAAYSASGGAFRAAAHYAYNVRSMTEPQ
jgi:tetratricopeptide (TPR) repeat protein